MPDRPPIIVPVTIRAEREFEHGPGSVFEAYADVHRRTQWIVPDDEVIVFESSDFRVGGTEHFLRGRGEKPSPSGTIRYEYIVDNQCIIYTERLASSEGQLLSISIVDWCISPSEHGAMLAVTDQTTSVVGSRPIEGARYRYEIMLQRLSRYLDDKR